MLTRYIKYCLFILFCYEQLIIANPTVANSIAIDNNNKIVIAGSFDNGETTDFLLIRYNQDGSLDTSFNPEGAFPGIVITPISVTGDDEIYGVVIDNSNRIVVAGYSNSIAVSQEITAGTTSDFTIARFNEDGSLDETFNGNGPIPGVAIIPIGLSENYATSIVIDNNNKIVAAGVTNSGTFSSFAVVRLNEDGTLDDTFNPDGSFPGLVVTNTANAIESNNFVTDASFDGATSVTIDNNNKIVAAGFAGDAFTNVAVIRYNPDGSLDGTFNPKGTLPSPIGAVGPRPGIVITPVNNSSIANSVTIDNNNKIVIAGTTTPIRNPMLVVERQNVITPANASDLLVIRYNNDGTLDTTLNPASLIIPVGPIPGVVVTNVADFNDEGRSVVIDNDNNIVVTGFSSDGTSDRFTTIRYNPDGTLDTTFNPTGVPTLFPLGNRPGIVITQLFVNNPQISQNIGDEESHAVIIDNNNKIVITGFSNDSVQNNATTIRYNQDGSLDQTFDQATSEFTQFPVGTIPGVVITSINLFNESSLIPGYRIDPLLPISMTEKTAPMVDAIIRAQEPFNVPIIALPDGGMITNDNQPVLQGIARPFDLVTITINDVPIATAQADIVGKWIVYLPPLIDGNYTLAATVIDRVTNLILKSPIKALVVDTEAPEPPEITSPESIAGSTVFIKQTNLTISGSAKPGSIVTLYLNDRPLADAVTDQSGKWTKELTFRRDGLYKLFAIAADEAGNVSLPSKIQNFVIDTHEAEPPVIRSPHDNTKTKRSQITIVGSSKPFVPVDVIVDGNKVSTVTPNGAGQWRSATELKSGKNNIKVQIKDPFNDKVLESEIISIIFSGDSPQDGDGRHEQNTDNAITGLAAPNSKVLIRINNKAVGQTVTDERGKWQFYWPNDLRKNGSISAVVIDSAGRERILRLQDDQNS